jgi:hypothetical protein
LKLQLNGWFFRASPSQTVDHQEDEADHDEGICNCGRDTDAAFEIKREEREYVVKGARC